MRILIVDDDRDSADSLATLAGLWGHETRTAYDGAAALQTISAYRPAVVVLDLAMPRLDGTAIARQLRQQTALPGPVLIAMSGFADANVRQRCANAGFDHFFCKPLDLDAFCTLLATLKQNLRLLDRTAELLEKNGALAADIRDALYESRHLRDKTRQLLRGGSPAEEPSELGEKTENVGPISPAAGNR
jgi:CheY-like chemotaxis protein